GSRKRAFSVEGQLGVTIRRHCQPPFGAVLWVDRVNGCEIVQQPPLPLLRTPRSFGSLTIQASPYRCVRSPAEGTEQRIEGNGALQVVLLHPRMPECRLRMIRIRLWLGAGKRPPTKGGGRTHYGG